MFDITISIWTLVLLSSLTGLGFGLYIKTKQKLDEANEILWANNLPQVIWYWSYFNIQWRSNSPLLQIDLWNKLTMKVKKRDGKVQGFDLNKPIHALEKVYKNGVKKEVPDGLISKFTE